MFGDDLNRCLHVHCHGLVVFSLIPQEMLNIPARGFLYVEKLGVHFTLGLLNCKCQIYKIKQMTATILKK